MTLGGRILSLALLLGPVSVGIADFTDTIFQQKDFISPWSVYEAHGMHYAFLYKNGIRFGSNTAGPFELTGHWNGNVLLSADPGGKGDIETAKIRDDGNLEVHAAAFSPDDPQVYVLHKVVPGQPPAGVAVAAEPAFTPPAADTGPKLSWPPPKGTITVGMTRDDLEKLPWRRTGFHHVADGSRAETYIYSYRCNDPTLIDLTVTVKNGRVVSINGGNG